MDTAQFKMSTAITDLRVLLDKVTKSVEPIQEAANALVVPHSTSNQQLKDSISLLYNHRSCIRKSMLPYAESWADKVNEVIAKLESI